MLRMLPLGDCYPTLRNLAQLLAIQVLHGLLNALGATDELMQMAVIEWVQLEIKTEAANRVLLVCLRIPARADLLFRLIGSGLYLAYSTRPVMPPRTRPRLA